MGFLVWGTALGLAKFLKSLAFPNRLFQGSISVIRTMRQFPWPISPVLVFHCKDKLELITKLTSTTFPNIPELYLAITAASLTRNPFSTTTKLIWLDELQFESGKLLREPHILLKMTPSCLQSTFKSMLAILPPKEKETKRRNKKNETVKDLIKNFYQPHLLPFLNRPLINLFGGGGGRQGSHSHIEPPNPLISILSNKKNFEEIQQMSFQITWELLLMLKGGPTQCLFIIIYNHSLWLLFSSLPIILFSYFSRYKMICVKSSKDQMNNKHVSLLKKKKHIYLAGSCTRLRCLKERKKKNGTVVYEEDICVESEQEAGRLWVEIILPMCFPIFPSLLKKKKKKKKKKETRLLNKKKKQLNVCDFERSQCPETNDTYSDTNTNTHTHTHTHCNCYFGPFFEALTLSHFPSIQAEISFNPPSTKQKHATKHLDKATLFQARQPNYKKKKKTEKQGCESSMSYHVCCLFLVGGGRLILFYFWEKGRGVDDQIQRVHRKETHTQTHAHKKGIRKCEQEEEPTQKKEKKSLDDNSVCLSVFPKI
ncbi:putative signal peptide protein [Puccinia sorghi]|uniref:Putative signal peptide protein n=1 Tax=Puccinia sorghi TaxID=27349 RepID=A0A0L6VA41_9BASI|nr:putative signal peptide protein [Puccinia sorghi]